MVLNVYIYCTGKLIGVALKSKILAVLDIRCLWHMRIPGSNRSLGQDALKRLYKLIVSKRVVRSWTIVLR